MDPAHHHITSTWAHGTEYDTQFYEEGGKTKHFTVTIPADGDVVQKGQYYHAHPEEVPRSFPPVHEHPILHYDDEFFRTAGHAGPYDMYYSVAGPHTLGHDLLPA